MRSNNYRICKLQIYLTPQGPIRRMSDCQPIIKILFVQGLVEFTTFNLAVNKHYPVTPYLFRTSPRLAQYLPSTILPKSRAN
jgi:hypothetical protein